MKLKKLICVSTAIILAASCLSGCNGNVNPPDEPIDLNVDYNVSAEITKNLINIIPT